MSTRHISQSAPAVYRCALTPISILYKKMSFLPLLCLFSINIRVLISSQAQSMLTKHTPAASILNQQEQLSNSFAIMAALSVCSFKLTVEGLITHDSPYSSFSDPSSLPLAPQNSRTGDNHMAHLRSPDQDAGPFPDVDLEAGELRRPEPAHLGSSSSLLTAASSESLPSYEAALRDQVPVYALRPWPMGCRRSAGAPNHCPGRRRRGGRTDERWDPRILGEDTPGHLQGWTMRAAKKLCTIIIGLIPIAVGLSMLGMPR